LVEEITAMTHGAPQKAFDTTSIHMEPHWLVTFQAPDEDVDRIFESIVSVVPLHHGKTDRNAYRTTAGYEYYRPREGTPTGAEDETRKRPGVAEVSFFLPRDQAQIENVIEAIYAVHSYYEPVITVQEVMRSRCRGLDDSKNPHRWWNKAGDWMAKG
jgi:hypothetical protein